jgi:hypothetical protein
VPRWESNSHTRHAKDKNSNAKIVWIALGQGGSVYRLEKEARNERAAIEDFNPAGRVTPDKSAGNDLNDPTGPETRRAPSSAGNIAKLLAVAASRDAGKYICESVAYKIYDQVARKELDFALFFHVPECPATSVGQQQFLTDAREFGRKLGELLGPNGDLDGDKISNKDDDDPTRRKSVVARILGGVLRR